MFFGAAGAELAGAGVAAEAWFNRSRTMDGCTLGWSCAATGVPRTAGAASSSNIRDKLANRIVIRLNSA
jgi:hypothetical protein